MKRWAGVAMSPQLTITPRDDHQVFKDDRKIGAAAIRRDQAHLLVQRVRPQHFARLAVVAFEQAAGAEGINIACLRIADDARPADARIGHVARPDVVPRLPDVFAGRGVDADDPFAFGGRAGVGPQNRVELAVHHDRRAAAAEIVALPRQIAAAAPVGIDRVGQPRLAADAVVFRPPPIRPIERIVLWLSRQPRRRK